MNHVGEDGGEVELPCGQSFDDAHGGAAARARPRRSRCGLDRRVGWWRRRRRQCRATRGQVVGAAAGGEQAKVADPDEALRQDVQQKAAQEFIDSEHQGADLAPVSIILPPKRDGLVGDGDEPVIGDGDAVGVPGEVVQHVARAAKGRLRIDHPRLAIEGSEPRAKGRFGGERRERARKVQVALCKGVTQTGDEFPAKDLAQYLHGEKEGRTRVDPPRSVWGQSAGGHDTVDMRMMLEALPPGVQDHEPANGGTQAPRVRGHLQKRGRGGAEEQVVHDALIGEREARQRLRHGEDKVHVADRQELLLPRSYPRVAGGGEALRAMAIPTANGELTISCLMESAWFWGAWAPSRSHTLGNRPVRRGVYSP